MRPGFSIMSQRINLKVAKCRAGFPRPKKFKTQPSAGKVMATLGCTRRYYVGLSSKEKYNNRCILCKFVRLTENCDP